MDVYLGIRKKKKKKKKKKITTLNRIMAELFWSGVCRDIAGFCRSCDICQRTIKKGLVTKVPLGKLLPLIDTLF